MCYVYTHAVAIKKITQPYMTLTKVSTLHGSRVAKTELAKTTSCRVVVLRRPLGHWRGQATCIVTSGGEPKGGGGRLEAQLEAG